MQYFEKQRVKILENHAINATRTQQLLSTTTTLPEVVPSAMRVSSPVREADASLKDSGVTTGPIQPKRPDSSHRAIHAPHRFPITKPSATLTTAFESVSAAQHLRERKSTVKNVMEYVGKVLEKAKYKVQGDNKQIIANYESRLDQVNTEFLDRLDQIRDKFWEDNIRSGKLSGCFGENQQRDDDKLTWLYSIITAQGEQLNCELNMEQSTNNNDDNFIELHDTSELLAQSASLLHQIKVKRALMERTKLDSARVQGNIEKTSKRVMRLRLRVAATLEQCKLTTQKEDSMRNARLRSGESAVIQLQAMFRGARSREQVRQVFESFAQLKRNIRTHFTKLEKLSKIVQGCYSHTTTSIATLAPKLTCAICTSTLQQPVIQVGTDSQMCKNCFDSRIEEFRALDSNADLNNQIVQSITIRNFLEGYPSILAKWHSNQSSISRCVGELDKWNPWHTNRHSLLEPHEYLDSALLTWCKYMLRELCNSSTTQNKQEGGKKLYKV